MSQKVETLIRLIKFNKLLPQSESPDTSATHVTTPQIKAPSTAPQPKRVQTPWNDDSKPFRVVLLGGGLANTQVIKNISRQNGIPKHFELILVSDHHTTLYSGMCPGGVAGQYKEEDFSVDLQTLGSFFGWKFICERVTTIDADNNRLITVNNSVIEYDVLSVAIGSTNAGLDADGVKEHAICTRPLKDLMRKMDTVIAKVQRLSKENDSQTVFDVVTVGGGCAGCELTMSMHHRLESLGIRARHTIITSRESVLFAEPDKLRENTEFILRQKGITVIANHKVVRCTRHSVVLTDDCVVPCDVLLWATGAAPHKLTTNLACDANGYILVNRGLQSTSHPNVFGTGDCISFADFPTGFPPKAGVFAVRQGPTLIGNLFQYFLGKHGMDDLSTFEPQTDFLRLLNTGDGSAIGCRFGFSFRGAWVWQLKDWIDIAWMKKFDPELLKNEDTYVCIPDVNNMDEEISPQHAVASLYHVDTPDDCRGYDTQWKILVRMMRNETFRNSVLEAMGIDGIGYAG